MSGIPGETLDAYVGGAWFGKLNYNSSILNISVEGVDDVSDVFSVRTQKGSITKYRSTL